MIARFIAPLFRFAIVACCCALPSAAIGATIAIDIGHSLASQGSRSAAGHGEYLYNRALALEIARILEASGHKIDILNREGTIKSLAARPARAAAIKADLFISIHHDSIQPQLMNQRERYRGYSAWVSGSNPHAAASLTCARTIASTMRKSGMRPALFHADKIPGEGHQLLDAGNGIYRRDGLAVLRLSKTPAVLIEAGVIVNPVEEAWLNNPRVRAAIAQNIAAGIHACVPKPRSR